MLSTLAPRPSFGMQKLEPTRASPKEYKTVISLVSTHYPQQWLHARTNFACTRYFSCECPIVYRREVSITFQASTNIRTVRVQVLVCHTLGFFTSRGIFWCTLWKHVFLPPANFFLQNIFSLILSWSSVSCRLPRLSLQYTTRYMQQNTLPFDISGLYPPVTVCGVVSWDEIRGDNLFYVLRRSVARHRTFTPHLYFAIGHPSYSK